MITVIDIPETERAFLDVALEKKDAELVGNILDPLVPEKYKEWRLVVCSDIIRLEALVFGEWEAPDL